MFPDFIIHLTCPIFQKLLLTEGLNTSFVTLLCKLAKASLGMGHSRIRWPPSCEASEPALLLSGRSTDEQSSMCAIPLLYSSALPKEKQLMERYNQMRLQDKLREIQTYISTCPIMSPLGFLDSGQDGKKAGR